MNISLFKVISKVVILFEVIMILLGIGGTGLLLSRGFEIDMGFSNLVLLPEDPDLLNNYQGMELKLKDDPELQTHLFVTKTKIKLMNTTNFKGFLMAVLLFLAAFSVALLEQMRRMVKTVNEGNPFIRANVWRIYILGTLFMLVPVFARILFSIQHSWLQSAFEFKGLVLATSSISEFPWILGGFLFLTIGKIMAEGIKLKEEQELTI